MHSAKQVFAVIAFFIGTSGIVAAQERPARVTIISDAFGKESALERSWGYAALVEYGGRRILFDTGGKKSAFVDNTKKLSIDLRSLDFVVLSHRHGDHTGGVTHLLEVNPTVKIYAPVETGSFGTPAGGPILASVRKKIDGLPVDLTLFRKEPAGANCDRLGMPGCEHHAR